MPDNLPIATVAELPDYFAFVNDSDEVFHLSMSLGRAVEHRYGAFFVYAVNGEYVEVWGMFGVIPVLTRPVYRVL